MFNDLQKHSLNMMLLSMTMIQPASKYTIIFGADRVMHMLIYVLRWLQAPAMSG